MFPFQRQYNKQWNKNSRETNSSSNTQMNDGKSFRSLFSLCNIKVNDGNDDEEKEKSNSCVKRMKNNSWGSIDCGYEERAGRMSSFSRSPWKWFHSLLLSFKPSGRRNSWQFVIRVFTTLFPVYAVIRKAYNLLVKQKKANNMKHVTERP